MGMCECCGVGCGRLARVAPEGPQHSRSWERRTSPEEQALDFVNVCAEVAKQEQPEATREKVASTKIRFFSRVAVISIACPTLYFCVLLPLQFDGLPAWCWGSYYWTCMLVGASAFAQSHISASCGSAPHWAASVCVLTTAIAVEVAICMADISGSWVIVAQVLCVLMCVYWPSFHKICCCARREGTYLKDSLVYLAGMLFGAIPCAAATAAYVLVLHYGWVDDTRLVAVLLIIWSAMPIVMKLAGKHIFIHGSPASQALAPVLWVYYVEVTFACLGLGLFNNAAGSAMAYACSFAAMLMLQVARGSQMCYRYFPVMGSLNLHRLILFFEMFAALIGRVTSYALFLCFGILRLVRGEEEHQTVVTSYIDTLSSRKINLYASQSISVASILTGMLGFAIVVSIFVALMHLLPVIWAPEANGQHEDLEATGKSRSGSGSCSAPQQDARPENGLESTGVVPAITVQAPLPGKKSSWIQEAGPVAASTMQDHLLLSFMVEYRFFMVSTLVFIFGLCILLTDLASGIARMLQTVEDQ